VSSRLRVVEAVSEVRGKLIWVTPKSHQVRSGPIPRFLVDDLALVMAGKAPGDVVFTTRRGAVLRNLNFRSDVFDKATTANGLEDLTPSRAVAYGGLACGQRLRQRESSPADAWARFGRDDPGRVLGRFDDDLDGVAERRGSCVLDVY